jgi:hypothetical protein
VATASYRLLPQINLKEGEITGADAAKLADMCPMGVFDIEDMGGSRSAIIVIAFGPASFLPAQRGQAQASKIWLGKARLLVDWRVAGVHEKKSQLVDVARGRCKRPAHQLTIAP